MYCRHCGTANPDGTTKCVKCGVELPARPAPARMETTVFETPAQPTSVLSPSEDTGQGFRPNTGPTPSTPFNQMQNQNPAQFAPMPNPAPPQFADPYAPPFTNSAPSTSQSNTLSIVSLVTGILGIVLCFCYAIGILPSVAALITGYMAMNQIKISGQRGREMALAGMITGGIGVALGIIYIVLLIVGISLSNGGAFK